MMRDHWRVHHLPGYRAAEVRAALDRLAVAGVLDRTKQGKSYHYSWHRE